MEDRVRRGAEARQILENPMVVAAFRAIEDELFARWLASGVTESAGREDLYRMNAAMRIFKARFEAEIAGAEIARAQAKQRGIEP